MNQLLASMYAVPQRFWDGGSQLDNMSPDIVPVI
jgi:hypothetical protein